MSTIWGGGYTGVDTNGGADGEHYSVATDATGVIWFSLSWDGVTWTPPVSVGTASAAYPQANVRQEHPAGGSRLIVVTGDMMWVSYDYGATWAPFTG